MPPASPSETERRDHVGTMRRMADDWPAIVALAQDRSSGATEIVRRSASLLTPLPRRRLIEALEILLRGHPSMAQLWRLGSEARWAPFAHPQAIQRFVRDLDRDAEASVVAADALPERVLTISWSSSVAHAIRHRRPRLALCMRSEPGGEGERTAKLLEDAAERVEVVEDGDALERVPADAVVVGADAVTPRAVVNKIGTARLAAAARGRDVPRFVVAGETKFVADDVPIVEPFEAAPLDLFTGVATADGVLTPAEVRRRARCHPVHFDLVPLLEELGGGGNVA